MALRQPGAEPTSGGSGRPPKIISLCGRVGFPSGLALTQAIGYVVRALAEGGADVEVFHLGADPYGARCPRVGHFHGIPYRHLALQDAHPRGFVGRLLAYLWAWSELVARLASFRLRNPGRPLVLWCYIYDDRLFSSIALWCKLLRIEMVVEVMEWKLGWTPSAMLDHWLFRNVRFRAVSSVVVISRDIEQRIRSGEVATRRDLAVYRRPTMIDATEMRSAEGVAVKPATLLWCGDARGYFRDVQFLVRVLGALAAAGVEARLELIGAMDDVTRDAIATEARTCGVQPERICIRGYVERAELVRSVRSTTVAMQPLWEDVRSAARFPNKLGEYLSGGRPVVTCGVGEVKEYLHDGVDAVFYRAGDVASCAAAVSTLLADSNKAAAIGAAGQKLAWNTFAYSAQSEALCRVARQAAKLENSLQTT